MDERFEEHMNKTALTEDIVRQYGQLLPVAVLRPSFVIVTNEELDWTDNIDGLNGVIAGVALGIIRIMHEDLR
uniref:Fatty acyl-CoA reductase n=1 Tax=Anopheles albimanus TaxID=7167 RepID=A0A182FPT2_ANOAL